MIPPRRYAESTGRVTSHFDPCSLAAHAASSLAALVASMALLAAGLFATTTGTCRPRSSRGASCGLSQFVWRNINAPSGGGLTRFLLRRSGAIDRRSAVDAWRRGTDLGTTIEWVMAASPSTASGLASRGSPSLRRSRRPVQRSRVGEPGYRSQGATHDAASHRRQEVQSTATSQLPEPRLQATPRASARRGELSRRKASQRTTNRFGARQVSRSATASSAAISSAVRRTATTCIGSAPRPGRPRPRRFNSSTS